MFSAVEIERVNASLDQIVAEVHRTQRLTKIQTRMLLQAIDESRAAASRVGRKDWIMILYAQMLGTIAAAAIQPDVSQVLALAARTALSWLAGHPALPLHP
jgi:hypothetical protein